MTQETDAASANATEPAVGSGSLSQDHVVILVHGIRDYALWQDAIRTELETAGFKVELTNYERFNLLEFLEPSTIFRRRAIAEVWEDIRTIKQNNPGALLSVIAHSFGTYVIARIMQKNFDVQFHKVIFCGSVVRYGFPFKRLQNQFKQPILNEVGTRDIWPAIAESVTIGYGSAGTYGFRKPLIRDRWHNGAHHGFFLDSAFCKNFWVPFLRGEKWRPGSEQVEKPSSLLVLLSIFKLKYLIVMLALFFGVQWSAAHLRLPWPWRTPQTFAISDYLGSWHNRDPNTRSITRIVLSREAAGLKLKVWGSCVPTDCEWPEMNAKIYGKDAQSKADINVSSVEADSKADWSETGLTLRMVDSETLSVDVKRHYTDGSGRSDFRSTSDLRRTPR